MQTRHDLGCALATLGDLPRALQLFDEVSTRFVELGHDASVPLLSRAEALLLGGLSADALIFSQDAARRLHAEGNHSAAAEALVAVAEAARLEGDHDDGDRRRVAAPRLVRISTVVRLGARRRARGDAIATRKPSASTIADIDRLEALAEAAAAAGDVRGELYCAIACRRRGVRMRPTRSRRAARPSWRQRWHDGPRLLQARLASRHAVATVRLARGDLVGARRRASQGIRHARVDPTAARCGRCGVAVATQARSITHLAFRMATFERSRCARWPGWSAPAPPAGCRVLRCPPTDTAVAADFARLRAVAGDLRRAELAGEPTGELRHEQATLEQSMRAEWLKEERPGQGKVATLPA